MTKTELIKVLETIPDDMVVAFTHEDFPTDIRSIEIIDVTAPYSEKAAGAGYYYQSFYPEAEEVPVFKIAVIS